MYNINVNIKQYITMIDYRTTSTEDILKEVDKKWDRGYQNAIASGTLYDLGFGDVDDTDDIDSMVYLAECLSTAEWREWLVNNFLDN